MERSLFCGRHVFALSLQRASASSPLLLNQKPRSWRRQACTHTHPGLNVFQKYLCPSRQHVLVTCVVITVTASADRAGSLFVYFTAQIRGFNFLGKAKVKENLPDNCVNTWTKQAASIDGKIDLTQSSWISVWLLWIQQPLFQGKVPFSLKLLKTIFCPYSPDYLLNLTGALS